MAALALSVRYRKNAMDNHEQKPEPSDEPERITRNQDGRWAPGNSGNLKGKQKGCRQKTTVEMEKILAESAEPLMRRAIELALGDRGGPTLRAILPLLLGPVRDRANPVECDLPALRSAADVLAAFEAIANELRSGQLDGDSIGVLTKFLDSFRATLVAADQEVRLVAIEAALQQKGTK